MLETLPFLLIFNFAGNAALIGIWKEHQVAARQNEVGGNAGTFGADGAFGDLDDDVAAGRVNAWNIFLGDFGLVAFFAFALDEFDAAIEVAGNDVPVMEKGIFF